MEDKDMVDIDLESVIRFCQKFDKEYLDVLNSNAKKLKIAAASASATLGSTGMATKASAKLEIVADALYKASMAGEERIRELERKAQNELEHKNHIEEMFR